MSFRTDLAAARSGLAEIPSSICHSSFGEIEYLLEGGRSRDSSHVTRDGPVTINTRASSILNWFKEQKRLVPTNQADR